MTGHPELIELKQEQKGKHSKLECFPFIIYYIKCFKKGSFDATEKKLIKVKITAY